MKGENFKYERLEYFQEEESLGREAKIQQRV
jgi:hypothetical protein